MSDQTLKPLVINETERPIDGWDDPERGRVRWRTLFSKGVSASEGVTCGVALLGPGDWLARHRHAPPEVYYVVEGAGTVFLEGIERRVGPGDSVFIPGMALHGISQVGEAPLKFFYVFGVDSFDDVTYLFSPPPR